MVIIILWVGLSTHQIPFFSFLLGLEGFQVQNAWSPFIWAYFLGCEQISPKQLVKSLNAPLKPKKKNAQSHRDLSPDLTSS